MSLFTLFVALLAIFIVVLVHEWGHFIVAKLMGVKVLRFSIGFGKPLLKKTARSGTEYVLAALPLGGYVKMLDEQSGDVATEDLPKTFNRQAVWRRMLITIAGPMMNFILALIIFWAVLLPGVTYHQPVIAELTPNSIAAQAGLKEGDSIVSIDGKSIDSEQALFLALVTHIGGQTNMSMKVKSEKTQAITTHELPLSQWKQQDIDEQLLSTLGITLYSPPMPALIEQVSANSPAEQAGLKPGDQIIAINQQRIKELPGLFMAMTKLANQKVDMTVLRQGVRQQLTVQLTSKKRAGKEVGFLGVSFAAPQWPENRLTHIDYNVLTAWAPAFEQTWGFIALHGVILKKLVLGELSLKKTLGGPVSIVRGAGSAGRAGVKSYFIFVAFISIALGFINVLPFPVLDGGHLLLQVIEAITRRPVPIVVQNVLWIIGIGLLVFLMLLVTYNDITRWLLGT